MPRLSTEHLFAHIIRRSAIDMRTIGWHDEDAAQAAPRRRRRNEPARPEVLHAWRIADLLHNTPADLFSPVPDTYVLWPDDTTPTGPQLALINWTRLLPVRYGISTQDDLVLNWAADVLRQGGWTLASLYRWASPHIFGDREYPTCPTAVVA